MIHHFIQFFERDLGIWKKEILEFKTEEDLWKIKGELKNSAGNLTLHIIGNLNHFMGATLGNTGYVRQRDKEFSEKNVARDEMIRQLEEVQALVKNILSGRNEKDLAEIYPLETFGAGKTTHYVLIQLVTHLNYHLGQVNSLRRIL